MSKRLLYLEKVTTEGSKDPFTWYCLAMEYAGQNRYDDALRTYRALRDIDPDYVPQYLMCGQMLIEATHEALAKEWLSAGLTVAEKKGDKHAYSEIQNVLAKLGE